MLGSMAEILKKKGATILGNTGIRGKLIIVKYRRPHRRIWRMPGTGPGRSSERCRYDQQEAIVKDVAKRKHQQEQV